MGDIFVPGVDDINYITGSLPEDSAVVHTDPADVTLLDVMIKDTVFSERWLMLFDALSLPLPGTSPAGRWTIPATLSAGTRQRIIEPLRVIQRVQLGIVVAISETPGVLTVTTAAEAWFKVKGKALQ